MVAAVLPGKNTVTVSGGGGVLSRLDGEAALGWAGKEVRSGRVIGGARAF